MDEFGDRLKWMEKIVEGLDGIDAESKIQEHDELLDQLDIRDINDTISNLASEEYVNQEIEDLHTYINEQCERIDYLEQIFGGFKNILNEKEEF
jgi:GTP cyclohydrolase III